MLPWADAPHSQVGHRAHPAAGHRPGESLGHPLWSSPTSPHPSRLHPHSPACTPGLEPSPAELISSRSSRFNWGLGDVRTWGPGARVWGRGRCRSLPRWQHRISRLNGPSERSLKLPAACSQEGGSGPPAAHPPAVTRPVLPPPAPARPRRPCWSDQAGRSDSGPRVTGVSGELTSGSGLRGGVASHSRTLPDPCGRLCLRPRQLPEAWLGSWTAGLQGSSLDPSLSQRQPRGYGACVPMWVLLGGPRGAGGSCFSYFSESPPLSRALPWGLGWEGTGDNAGRTLPLRLTPLLGLIAEEPPRSSRRFWEGPGVGQGAAGWRGGVQAA